MLRIHFIGNFVFILQRNICCRLQVLKGHHFPIYIFFFLSLFVFLSLTAASKPIWLVILLMWQQLANLQIFDVFIYRIKLTLCYTNSIFHVCLKCYNCGYQTKKYFLDFRFVGSFDCVTVTLILIDLYFPCGI